MIEHYEAAHRREPTLLEVVRRGESRLSGADDDDVGAEPERRVGAFAQTSLAVHRGLFARAS